MGFHLSEALANGIKRIVPRARAKGLSIAFDHVGPELILSTECVPLECSLHRLMCALVDVMDAGVLFVEARVSLDRLGDCRLALKAAGTGRLAEPRAVSDVMARLLLHERWLEAGDGSQLRRAHGVCPRTGGVIGFTTLGQRDAMLTAEAVFQVDDADERPLPSAGQARAWVVDPDGVVAASLVRRLQRHGWAVASFVSAVGALERLRSLATGDARPALLVVAEAAALDTTAARLLGESMPGWTQKVLAVCWSSACLGDDEALPGFVVEMAPFSPLSLLRLARGVSGEADAGSGLTDPAPLLFDARPVVLVVDDEPVNRFVETSMVQALGFEAVGAASGEEAIHRCGLHPPSLVVMDLQMPQLDGFEATRRLRAMQLSGEVAPFAIVAATAFPEAQVHAPCVDCGMDGILVKPVPVAAMRSQLRRLVLQSSAR